MAAEFQCAQLRQHVGNTEAGALAEGVRVDGIIPQRLQNRCRARRGVCRYDRDYVCLRLLRADINIRHGGRVPVIAALSDPSAVIRRCAVRLGG